MRPEPFPPQRVESPCIKVCTLDAQNVCTGCGRTISEIVDWPRMTAQEQLAVCERAAQRRGDGPRSGS